MAGFNLVIDLNKYKSSDNPFIGFDKKVQYAIDSAIDEIEDRLLSKLLERMDYYGLADMSLTNDVFFKRTSDGIFFGVKSEYGMFVEFGTGIVGQNNPHPNPAKEGWQYDTNAHGEVGWFYPTTESDSNPYKHMYNGQLYGWTRGLPSRPFMYDTWIYGTRITSSIIRKHMRRIK